MLGHYAKYPFLMMLLCGLSVSLICDGANGQQRDGNGERRRGPGKLLDRFDENGDGQLARSEVPEEHWSRLSRGDKNEDGVLNAKELKQYMQRSRERGSRRGSGGNGPKIGEKAPGWSSLVGVDDDKHSLEEYAKAKAIVLVFTCNHCPVAKAYEDRLVELQKDYNEKGVQVVAVNVNNMPADRLDKMKERAKQKKFNFPYLYDSTQKIGLEYGATKTPEVYLLDQDRKLAYHGAIDDSKDVEKVKVQHLRVAIDAVLAGKKPMKAEVKAMGCGIRYE